MEISSEEARVLGCLIEKRATTPEHYPLTTNSLTNACNQKSSREPVMQMTSQAVTEAMMELRGHELCRSTISGRTDKHKHVLDEVWNLTDKQLACLAIMLLRGPQSAGEIRTRTDRYVSFESLEEILDTLASLASAPDGGRPKLCVNLGRGAGQSQDRWAHLLCAAPESAAPDSVAPSATTIPATSGETETRGSRVAELETKVQRLEARLARIESELELEVDVDE